MRDLDISRQYCREARDIVARGESLISELRDNGSYEGHILIAIQVLSALRRLDRFIDEHGKRLAASEPLAANAHNHARLRNWRLVFRWPSRRIVVDFDANG